jgi:hypothetical protein
MDCGLWELCVTDDFFPAAPAAAAALQGDRTEAADIKTLHALLILLSSTSN